MKLRLTIAVLTGALLALLIFHLWAQRVGERARGLYSAEELEEIEEYWR